MTHISLPPLHEKKWSALNEHILPRVATLGWDEHALFSALAPEHQPTLRAFFPQGVRDMLTCLNQEHLRQLGEHGRAHPTTGTKATLQAALLHKAHMIRSQQALAHKTTAYLALHPHLARDLSLATINQLWQWAGDTSTPSQSAYHTKRLTLGYVYLATVLYAQKSPPPEDDALKAFIDRRLAEVAQGATLLRPITDKIKDTFSTAR
ncbi:MAG: hypothetical protein GDA50_02815 [Alphaproteobacteria bacterium GM202ARS2]|nr:hypothetical protein [Alphaproteobacteria bacterium GM202ARS2]